MKNVYVMAFVALSLVIMSNRGGRGVGSTGAPGESGATCANCHGGADFNGSIDIKLTDADDNEVADYLPGQEYTVTVQVAGDGAAGFGFQAIAIGEDDMQAGTFSELGLLVKTVNSFDRTYLSHSNRKPDGIFTAKWTAPETSSGNITFYSSGIAANGNNTTAGDQPLIFNKVFTEATSTSTANEEPAALSIYPNPTTDYLLIESEETFDYNVYDLTGRILLSGQTSQSSAVDVSDLALATYFIALSKDGVNTITRKFVKQ